MRDDLSRILSELDPLDKESLRAIAIRAALYALVPQLGPQEGPQGSLPRQLPFSLEVPESSRTYVLAAILSAWTRLVSADDKMPPILPAIPFVAPSSVALGASFWMQVAALLERRDRRDDRRAIREYLDVIDRVDQRASLWSPSYFFHAHLLADVAAAKAAGKAQEILRRPHWPVAAADYGDLGLALGLRGVLHPASALLVDKFLAGVLGGNPDMEIAAAVIETLRDQSEPAPGVGPYPEGFVRISPPGGPGGPIAFGTGTIPLPQPRGFGGNVPDFPNVVGGGFVGPTVYPGDSDEPGVVSRELPAQPVGLPLDIGVPVVHGKYLDLPRVVQVDVKKPTIPVDPKPRRILIREDVWWGGFETPSPGESSVPSAPASAPAVASAPTAAPAPAAAAPAVEPPVEAIAPAGIPVGTRYTDVSVFSGAPDKRGERVGDEALVFGKAYSIEVAIRQVVLGLRARGERTDPTRLLPKDGPSELLAVLTSHEIRPHDAKDIAIPFPVQTLTVPVAGDSKAESNALFHIEPQRGSGATRRCTLILRLYHKLDLVDQQRITLVIGAEKTATDPAGAASSPRLFIEAMTDRTLPDFALDLVPRALNIVVSRPPGRSSVQLDFVLPHKEVHLSASVEIGDDRLTDLLARTRDQLFAMTMAAPDDGIKVGIATYRKDLKDLAGLGERVRNTLFDYDQAGLKASLRRVEEVLKEQLVPGAIVQIAIDRTASNFRFPWSLLFCGEDSRQPRGASDFWGYRYIIEEKPAHLQLDDPVPGTKHEVCFGGWEHFKTLEAQRLALGVGKDSSPPIAVTAVDSRDELLVALKGDTADMVYVFAHGHSCAPLNPAVEVLLEKVRHAKTTRFTRDFIKVFKDPGASRLEANDCWIKLTKSLVTTSDLQRDDYLLKRRPIVFLNMCQSAVLWPGAAGGFVDLFLHRNAAAVLGTECTVPETVADAFGRLVLGKLFQRESIGASLLHARQKLAESNNLLGLAYCLYGSASARMAIA